MLAGIAVLPAALPATTEAAADPVFAVLVDHRTAHAVHLAAIDETDRLEEADGRASVGGHNGETCHAENDAFTVLLSATMSSPEQTRLCTGPRMPEGIA
ncbi:hypothetical protein [Bradyrhizobium genosp. P]|uniref:hypothetical protein n=1 Tax=Bradyrhizobium genosp. P TaxID=83641 RepID=UPI003CF5863E